MRLYEIRRRRRKRKRLVIWSIFAILVLALTIFLTVSAKAQYGALGELVDTPTVRVITPAEPLVIEIQETETPEPVNYPTFSYSKDWDAKDSYLLAKIAMAEAEGESIQGKTLVILVVLNRVHDDNFPNTIQDVIYEPGQFSPVANGCFDSVEPDDDCWEAVYEVMTAEYDYSGGALYFESCENADNWHSRNLEFLYQCGNHKFYK